jgi:hypothetical protein
VREFYNNKTIKNLIPNLNSKLSGKNELTSRDLGKSLETIFEAIAIPYPNKDIVKYFAQTGIIGELLLDINNSHWLERDDREEISKDFHNLLKRFPTNHTGEELRFRILGNFGTYPINEIKSDKTWYSNFGHRPNLITVNKIEPEGQFRNDSWLYWISRRELKFATSIILAAEYIGFFPYFNSFDAISLNTSFTNKIPKSRLFEFLNHWLDIKNSFGSTGSEIFKRQLRPDITTYKFDKFDTKENGFEKLFNSYSIRNHLLLRTSNYFIKALMNRINTLCQEEALLNAFLPLEGSLHLLQKKYGDNSPKLNRVLLKSIFKNEIKYLPDGEGTYEFIEESYSTRISLVHPELKWGAQWNPFVHIGDFREYFGLSKIILNWVLAEREIDLMY